MKSPLASTTAFSLALNRLQASVNWVRGMLANPSTMAALRAFWVLWGVRLLVLSHAPHT